MVGKVSNLHLSSTPVGTHNRPELTVLSHMLNKLRVRDICAMALLINAAESSSLVKLSHDGMNILDSFKREG
jgi:hypothetical protein